MAFELYPPTGCPSTATILGAYPPSGVLDARKPFPPATHSPLYGIGMPDDPATSTNEWSPVRLNLGTSGIPPHCFTLCETPPRAVPNWIASVMDDGTGWYTLTLGHGITPDAVTTIQYLGDGSFVSYIHHPANVDASSMANIQDLIQLINRINVVMGGGYVPPWEVDINYSMAVTVADMTELINILNGAGGYAPGWMNTPKPANVGCP